MTDNTPIYTLLTAVLLPALIATVNRPYWPQWVKATTAAACIIGSSVFWVWYAGLYTANNIAETTRTLIGVTVGVYVLVYKPLGIKRALENGVNGGISQEKRDSS